MSRLLSLLLLGLATLAPLIATAQEPAHPAGRLATKPLYRDPTFDGAADPVVIWNAERQRWWMFYTNRRAKAEGLDGVTWVHGTHIGIAESDDEGASWNYVGLADVDLPPEIGGDEPTQWAPDVIRAPDGVYHMFLTVVPGVFTDWNHPRTMVHLTSTNLRTWRHPEPLKLASDRVIDAVIFPLPSGGWRLWYNNERDRKSIYYADSPDLSTWTDKGKAAGVGERPGEGPYVFSWKGHYWMLVDVWKGLGVYRSDDLLHWTAQAGNLLGTPGHGEDDRVIGGHPGAVVSNGRAFLFYFTHPGRAGGTGMKTKEDGYAQRRSSIQVVELGEKDGALTADRDAPTYIQLKAPARAVPVTAAISREPFPVAITVDASKVVSPLRPIWRYFGADEPNYATMKDGQQLLADLGALAPGQIHFRTHNLLTTGDGTPALKWGSTNAYTEDAAGHPVYDWRIVDRIFDSYLARGVKPLAQIGFMPEALSIQPEPYRHAWRPGLPYNDIYTGWTKPPKDYGKWGELAYQWTKHSVEKYGAAAVNTWWWEVWNEPNGGRGTYWDGSTEEFLKLHDYAVAGVRRALPTARVGGPDTAGPGGQFMKDFLEHALRGKNYATGEKGTPLDFIAFHAKGSPSFVDGHVRMGIANQLQGIDKGFAIIAGYPELKATPIIIGESDPEGCAACTGPQMAYRNGTMYSSYTAAVFARKHDLAAKYGANLEGAVTWAFTFEDQPYFAGFRQLASNGINLAVFNVFKMYSLMGEDRLAAQSSGELSLEEITKNGVRKAPDVGVLASRSAHRVAVMVWHYHDDDVAGPDAAVKLALAALPAGATHVKVTHYRIDQNHSNAYAEWLRMGSPLAPNPRQYAALKKASELAALTEEPDAVEATEGKLALTFNLPRQGVSLIVVEWP